MLSFRANQSHLKQTQTIAFSPNGKLLATTSRRQPWVNLFEPEESSYFNYSRVSLHQTSPNNNLDWQNSLRIWSSDSFELVYEWVYEDTFDGRLFWSDNNNKVATSHSSDTIIWNLNSKMNVKRAKFSRYKFRDYIFAEDSNWLIWVDNIFCRCKASSLRSEDPLSITSNIYPLCKAWNLRSEKVKIFDKNSTIRYSLQNCRYYGSCFLNLGWVAFVCHLAGQSENLLIGLYSYLDNRYLFSVKPDNNLDIRNIFASFDNHFLAIQTNGVEIWNLNSREKVAYCKSPEEICLCACFTPDARHLMTLETDSIIRLWDTVTWQVVREYNLGIGRLTALTVAPDGLRYAAGTDNGQIIIWDADL